ncbi:MAG: hypothetical protein LBH05_07845 [Deferribacteraceae bacterium]|jgi:alcohol dehydrogenase YqhD (iron-dependent ADH family)|nr:hypothetical protein [Deferribacteraceae bacterium]
MPLDGNICGKQIYAALFEENPSNLASSEKLEQFCTELFNYIKTNMTVTCNLTVATTGTESAQTGTATGSTTNQKVTIS